MGSNEKFGGHGSPNNGEMTRFDDLMEEIGTKGRWNLTVLIVCCAIAFVAPLQNLSYEFLGAIPDHWCQVPQLEQLGWSQEKIREIGIPKTNDSKPETCLMYDFSDIDPSQNGTIDQSKSRPIVACTSRVFNLSQYSTTVVTKWDLICEDESIHGTLMSLTLVGKMLGAFIYGYLLDVFGRNQVIKMCSMLMMFSGFMDAASPNLFLHILLRLTISSMAMGAYLGSFILAMELCTESQRSFFGPMFVLPHAFGHMLLPAIAYLVRNWQWLQATLTIPAVILFAYLWLLPESFRWLLLEGFHEQALDQIQFAAKINRQRTRDRESLLKSCESIKLANKETEPETTIRDRCTFRVCGLVLIPHLRTRTWIVNTCWFTLGLIYFSVGVSLNRHHISEDPYMFMFYEGLIEIPAYLILWPAIIFLGRRMSLIASYIILAASIALVTILTYFPNIEPVGPTIVFSLLGKLTLTSVYHLMYIYTAELFPTKYRAHAVGQGVVIEGVGTILCPYFIKLFSMVTVWTPSVLFVIILLVTAGFVILLPETNHKDDMAEETHLYKTNHDHPHIPTRALHFSMTKRAQQTEYVLC
ncbi:unnamed protein product, partial [Meganyctiphanes norvegica]